MVLGSDMGWAKTSRDLEVELDMLNPARVEVLVDSFGGCGVTGMNTADILRRYNASATVTGRCCSSALIAICGCSHVRAFPSARLMIHQPYVYIMGTASELLNEACHLETLTNCVHGLIRERTEQPASVVTEWLSRDTWFSAQEALSVGLVDEICEVAPARDDSSFRASQPPTETEAEKVFQTWLAAFGKIEVADKEKFARKLNEFLIYKVREVEPAPDQAQQVGASPPSA